MRTRAEDTAAKAGLLGLMRVLALEYGPQRIHYRLVRRLAAAEKT